MAVVCPIGEKKLGLEEFRARNGFGCKRNLSVLFSLEDA